MQRSWCRRACPPARADPLCADPCTINASSNLPDAPGYNPAVAVVANGSTIVWHSSDAKSHPHAEVNLSSNCIGVTSTSSADSPAVFFEIWNGTLRTTVGGNTTTCSSAKGAEAVGFVVNYRCVLHANMNGAIVVLADS